jgi:hypothetical protein
MNWKKSNWRKPKGQRGGFNMGRAETKPNPPPLSFGHLPQMPSTEFGGGEYELGMFIFIYAQLEIVLPPFASRCSSRDANGGS